MALLVATYLGHVYPSLKINVVVFGAPNVGDETFMKAFKQDVRHGSRMDAYLLALLDWY